MREMGFGRTNNINADWIRHSTQAAKFGTYGYYWWPAVQGGFAALGVGGPVNRRLSRARLSCTAI